MVESIWDSIAAENEGIKLSASQKKELDKRISKLDSGKSKLSSWEEVKKRIRAKL